MQFGRLVKYSTIIHVHGSTSFLFKIGARVERLRLRKAVSTNWLMERALYGRQIALEVDKEREIGLLHPF